MNEITRRKALRSGVFGCLASLSAGCLSQYTGTDKDPNEETTQTPSEGWLEVQNDTDSALSVSLTVTEVDSDDDVFEEQVSLDPAGHEGFENVFPEYQQYEVAVTVDDSRSKTQTVTYASNDWIGLTIIIRASEIEIDGVAP